MNVGTSVDMKPESTMRWREMRFMHGGAWTIAWRNKFFERGWGCNRNRRHRVIECSWSSINVSNVRWNSIARSIPSSMGAQKSGSIRDRRPSW